MGVVRRKGDWRLEKVEEGYYEITFQKESQMDVLTPEYDPGPFEVGPMGFGVREVDSYSEAVGLFEEKAHGPPPSGVSSGGGLLESTSSNDDGSFQTSSGSSSSSEEEADLTPGMLAIALILTGGLLAYTQWPSYTSRIFQMAILFTIAGVLILGWAGFLYRQKGWREAADFLFQNRSGTNRGSSGGSPDKTPPTPQKLKEEIIFDRADHHCEWCGQRFDRLHVHHIKPRSDGGPNTKRNLIALCPNCHEKADHGGISMTQLRGKVRRIMADDT